MPTESSYKELLLRVLTVMGCNEKEAYATEFEEMNNLEAVTICIEALPVSLREEIKTETDVLKVIKSIPKDVYEEVLTEVSAKAFFELLHGMKQVLSNDQKRKIVDIVDSY